MKKSFFIFAIFLLLIPSNPAIGQDSPPNALFVSVIQDPPVFSSQKAMKDLVRFAHKNHIQVLFVQVYRENKAWFKSSVADSKPYRDCVQTSSTDPLGFLIKEAHAKGIQIHAWMNLLSLATNEDAPLLKKYGPQILAQNLKEKKALSDYKIDDQYFLEPGDLRVRQALVHLVGEVLGEYPDLDGIQFDYIRYPDKNPAYGYTSMNMDRFKKETGQATIEEDSALWKNWKRDQVTGLLEELIQKARQVRPKIQVSTTGLVPFSRAYLEAFQDWRTWVASGLIDFVTLMCYSTDTQTFQKNIQDAKNKIGSLDKVNIAIGNYMLVASPEIFKEQFEICQSSASRACVGFHYESFLQNRAFEKILHKNSFAKDNSQGMLGVMKFFFYNPLVWLFTTILLLGACTYLPLWIKNAQLRHFVMRWVLVPVSIVIVVYVYQVGIEVFKKLALRF